MTRYAALLRGIGPGDPRMRNENLRAVCEDLGFGNVSTVISSGNIVFDSDRKARDVETELESSWREQLGFESATFVRSHAQLRALADRRPFGGLEHGPETYLLVTFAKRSLRLEFEFPHSPEGESFEVVGSTTREMFTVSYPKPTRTPNVMAWLEKQLGKDITSRTWLTVHRLLRKMGA